MISSIRRLAKTAMEGCESTYEEARREIFRSVSDCGSIRVASCLGSMVWMGYEFSFKVDFYGGSMKTSHFLPVDSRKFLWFVVVMAESRIPRF